MPRMEYYPDELNDDCTHAFSYPPEYDAIWRYVFGALAAISHDWSFNHDTFQQNLEELLTEIARPSDWLCQTNMANCRDQWSRERNLKQQPPAN